MTFQEVFEALSSQAGVIALFVIIIYGGYRGWWVWGAQYQDLLERKKAQRIEHLEQLATTKAECNAREAAITKERDEWKDLAIQGLQAAERVVTYAESDRNGGSGG